MPRNGSGVYSLPAGSIVTDGVDDILAAQHNDPLNDIALDMNTARPVVAGGTGATTALGARTNLELGSANTVSFAALNLTGNIISDSAGSIEWQLDKGASGNRARIWGETGGVGRWAVDLGNDTAESGSNVGSDFTIRRYDDTGTFVDNAVLIRRNTGQVLMGGELTFPLNSKIAWNTNQSINVGTGTPEGVVTAPIGSLYLQSDGGAGSSLHVKQSGTGNTGWAGLGDIFFRLNSDFAGANATGAQNLLPQNVTLLASTQYEYEIFYSLQKTAGVTSHTVSTLWGGTATFNNFRRNLLTTSVNAGAYAGVLASFGADNTPAALINASGTVNFADARVHIREMGTFSVNAGGTVIPQYQLSSAPGGAYSTTAGAFFRLRPLGASGANVSQGSWA